MVWVLLSMCNLQQNSFNCNFFHPVLLKQQAYQERWWRCVDYTSAVLPMQAGFLFIYFLNVCGMQNSIKIPPVAPASGPGHLGAPSSSVGQAGRRAAGCQHGTLNWLCWPLCCCSLPRRYGCLIDELLVSKESILFLHQRWNSIWFCVSFSQLLLIWRLQDLVLLGLGFRSPWWGICVLCHGNWEWPAEVVFGLNSNFLYFSATAFSSHITKWLSWHDAKDLYLPINISTLIRNKIQTAL